ncbi:MAG: ABC transporter ATP-binding protein [Pseudomonadota bacterium]
MSFETGEATLTAIKSVTGSIPEGRFISVIGPSGCGKSTLLDLICGLQRPTSGSVRIAGEPVKGARRDTAMVFQGDSTLHWRTVRDNVAFGLEIAGVAKPERLARAQEMIRLVGLAGFEDFRPRQLSGGMRQRVAIARALAMSPRILLMDEPFGSLDQQTRWVIGEELTRIWESTRNSVLFVTHDVHEAVLLSDEVWVMSNRPSTLKARIRIDLPRPRPSGIIRDARFTEYTGALWDLLAPELTRDTAAAAAHP